jgi:hypothetical protein
MDIKTSFQTEPLPEKELERWFNAALIRHSGKQVPGLETAEHAKNKSQARSPRL